MGLLALLPLTASVPARAFEAAAGAAPPGDKGDQGAFVLDGSFVHNAGELQVNITNWGLIGSQPGIDSSYSRAPSAMWPAGSGIDYLFGAGLWVGAVKNGIPLVSTGQFENELLPSSDPLDTIYETAEGQPGSGRFPLGADDDDGDGRLDEDPRDGRDNDRDGKVDEDFAAIGNQHFRLVMRDDTPLSQELWTNHEPLEIEVVQESYQWDNPALEDVVVFDYTIRNVGNDVLRNMAVGMYVDGDVGPRDDEASGQDDMVGLFQGSAVDRNGLPLPVSIATVYDCPGADGDIDGVAGFFFVNASEPPVPVSIRSFRYFAGNTTFEQGGDPTNDQERYDLLVGGGRQTPPPECEGNENDYRMLVAIQPQGAFLVRPGGEVRFTMAMVMGRDVPDMVTNAVELMTTFYGEWFDRDGDRQTGILGHERKVCKSDFGDPRAPTSPIFDLYIDCGFPSNCEDPLSRPLVVEVGDLDDEFCTWINGDCSYEISRGAYCGLCNDPLLDPDAVVPCTGIHGKEYNARWLAVSPPPSPPLRTWTADDRIHLFWTSEAEGARDPTTGLPVFEGYRVWRADGWTRPLGTSEVTGPSSDLWAIIAEFDRVDSYERRTGSIREELPLGANTGLDVIRYVPRALRPGSDESIRFVPLARLVERIVQQNPQLQVRSPIRYRDARGVISELGQQFPELRDWECCYAQLDTLAWDAMGTRFYEYVDHEVVNGIHYFHAVTVTSVAYDEIGPTGLPIGWGPGGNPRSNFAFGIPQSPAQSVEQRTRDGQNVYVVPNPATHEALAEFSQLQPNEDDPTGVRVEFRNLPRASNTIRIFTMSGDLVATLRHDGRNGAGSASWNLVSRNGQEVASGVYLFSVESGPEFDRVIGRFVVLR